MSRPATSTSTSIDRTGLAQGAGAYFIWGLLPLYFLPLKAIDTGEVLADRILLSLLLLAVIVAVTRRWTVLRAAFADPRALRLMALSAALISVNWLVYIWAVQTHHVLEASLGYFLNPLINVLIGVVVLRERLTRMQGVAVALAAIGVAVLALSAAGGLWISLSLALTFALYGLVRKLAPVGSLEGLTIETALLTPLAIFYLVWLAAGPGLGIGTEPVSTAFLLGAGVVTAVPLLLFAAAARRLPYSTLGLLQYLAPTLQFVVAITVSGEVLTLPHLICFAFIWSGLALYVASTVRLPRPAPPE